MSTIGAVARTTDRPAYRIQTDRIVLRCWQPTDAARRKEIVDASLPDLAQWLPWANDHPQPLAGHVATLRSYRAKFDLGESFQYALFDHGESRLLGGASLHPLQDNGFHLGYWLGASARRHGWASEAAAALTKMAFLFYRADFVELATTTLNERSGALAKRLGYTLEGTLRERPARAGQTGPVNVQLWGMIAREYPASWCAKLEARAWDAVGKELEGRP